MIYIKFAIHIRSTILHKHISNGTNRICIISAWMLIFLNALGFILDQNLYDIQCVCIHFIIPSLASLILEVSNLEISVILEICKCMFVM